MLRTQSTKSQASMYCLCSRQTIKLLVKYPFQRKGWEFCQDRQCSGMGYSQRESSSLFNHEKERLLFTFIIHQTSIECDRHGEKLDYWEEDELGRK